MDNPRFHCAAAGYAPPVHGDISKLEVVSYSRVFLSGVAKACGPVEEIALALEYPRVIGTAQTCRQLDERVEHGLQIERRTADDLQYVRGRRLLLQ